MQIQEWVPFPQNGIVIQILKWTWKKNLTDIHAWMPFLELEQCVILDIGVMAEHSF